MKQRSKTHGITVVLKSSLQKQFGVADRLYDGSCVDEVCTGVDSRPRTVLVVEILHAELCVWRCPRRLDGRNVAANDTSTRVSLGHFVVRGGLAELEPRVESIFQTLSAADRRGERT